MTAIPSTSRLSLLALTLLAGCQGGAIDPTVDAGRADGGEMIDGGPNDAGADDGGAVDPGMRDAGVDAPRRDAGGRDTGPDRDPPRCGATISRGERGILNDDPAFVSVFVNNIENLKEPGETCRGDWTDLMYVMHEARPQPDLFLVQQISDRAQLDRLVAFMNTHLRGAYAGVIAEASPNPMTSPCGPEKALQTNAIIYRTARFEPRGARETWQSFAFIDGECRRSRLARTMYVMHRFRDRLAARDVNVVSLHWSTNGGTGPDPACAEQNIEDLDRHAHMAGFDADLLIMGGDTNEPDRNDTGFRPWFRRARELDYTDPIHASCRDTSSMGRCLDENWTVGSERRIDFLFAQTGDGCPATTGRDHTISFDEADAAARRVTGTDDPLNYSDHRAVRAEIYY